ncbi:MAG TPA: S4 domain-containing protein [Methyloversatilis sp.]
MDRHGLVRADTLLVERGLAQSRAAAQRLILAGCVQADGVPLVKAAQTLRADAVVELTPDAPARNQDR